MKTTPHALRGLLRAVLLLVCSILPARSAVTFADLTLWAGSAPGDGVRQAALVIDFADGSPGLTWGYRWPATETRSGQDMLTAILGADPTLMVDSTVFPNSISYGSRARSFSDNGTPDFTDDLYWGYWVNNDVTFDFNDPSRNGHVLPPLGNPYAEGHWVESSTGLATRPLANGSWDGWSYGKYLTEPGSPIPEPATTGLVAILLICLRGRRAR